MKLIETKTLASSAGSIEFTDIPQDFTDLYILTSLRCNSGGTWVDAALRFNDSTTNYSERGLSGNGTSTASFTSTGVVVRIPSPGFTANTFSNDSVYIPNYTGSSAKGVSIDNVTENNGTTSLTQITAGLWNNSSAITKIVFLGTNGDLSANGTVSLYGIGGAGDGYAAPKATGGVISHTPGYVVHTFFSSGTFTPTTSLTNVEYVVVAGGGGGGGDAGGGAGAGGYRSSVTGESSGGGASAESKLSLTSGVGYTVTVGAGGAGGLSGNAGTTGSASVFSATSTVGGGGGGRGTGDAAKVGGSGGGGSNRGVPSTTVSGATPTANEGFSGGSAIGNGSGQQTGGGGGGAGAQGGDSSVGVAGSGGNGVASAITGSSTYRAGGGGGGSLFQTTHGTGGLGGGGNGPGGVGTIATGGGGAGNTLDSNGGAGGSGIVIVRYAA